MNHSNSTKEVLSSNRKPAACSSEFETDSEIESEGELLIDPTVPTRKLSHKEKMKTYLTGVNWKNISASVCLWLAVLTCSAAYSLMGPFFPQEVRARPGARAQIQN